jgi:hypothetical protein
MATVSIGMTLAKLGAATSTILWVVAVVLVIWGIVTLVRGALLVGLLLIILGFAIGPGGWTIWH